VLIGFLGDVHGRAFLALALVATYQRRAGQRLDLVVQVGDMGAFPRPFESAESAEPALAAHLAVDSTEADFARLLSADGETAECLRRLRAALTRPVHFLRGNHEDFAFLRDLPVDPLTGTAPADPFDLFRYVPDGTLLDCAGTHLAVLGGAEHHEGEGGIDTAAVAALATLAADTAGTRGGFDVLVTHQGHYGSSVGYRGNVQGSRLVTELVDRTRPRLHVFGHAHERIGPGRTGDTIFLGLAGLVASVLWRPEAKGATGATGAKGVEPDCLAVVDTEASGPLAVHPVAEPWLADFQKPFDLTTWSREFWAR